ncbi:MAG: transcriptional regulator [Alphaproteobacteria bacterium]|nr:transcriptional regulator [Alphaproteobacteria bacterium]
MLNSNRLESQSDALNELLARYALGSLDPALHTLVATHLQLKPENRRFVASLEEIEGRALEQSPVEAFSARDRALERIFAIPESPRKPVAHLAPSALPPALSRYIGMEFNSVPWRNRLPGVKEFVVEDIDGRSSSLLLISAGRAIPSHTHEGTETTLVLEGAFSDISGHYARGDIAFADAEIDHKPIVDRSADCLCFAVTEGHLHLTGPFGRLVDRFFGPGRTN